jgi:hypothetical protein
MIEKYSYYKFEVFYSSGVIPLDTPERWSGWVYKIHNDEMYGGDIEADEWFDTEQEARFAAIGHIGKLEDGPSGEPDYDAPTAEEMYQRAHEDRQKLRGR